MRRLIIASAVSCLLLVSVSTASAETDLEPLAEEPAPPPHPEPRVIVTVHSVAGPHKRKDVERAARLGWGRIVRCYKASPKRPRPRGSVRLELAISGRGVVTGARRTKSTLDREISSCLAKSLRGLSMPKARRRSSARIEVQLAPGDVDD